MPPDPATSTPPLPRLREGKSVPLFYLPSASGGESGPAALRSKYNMVLVFLEPVPAAEAYLRDLAGLNRKIEEEQARVMAVVAAPIAEVRDIGARLQVPFTLLADEGGTTTHRILGDTHPAALCVADRYGSIVYVELKSSVDELGEPRTALEWLEFVQIQCPE